MHKNAGRVETPTHAVFKVTETTQHFMPLGVESLQQSCATYN